MFSITGKRILVTGASSGIGEQIAISIASMGASLTLLGRDKIKLENVYNKLNNDKHSFFALDLTIRKDVEDFIDNCESFDGIVFCAGQVAYNPAKFINESKIDDLFDVNYKASVLLSQLLIKKRLVNRGGSLIFISSISSKLGVPGTSIYASSKAALSAYAKVLASEVAKSGIRSNAICPGIIRTPMTDKALDVTNDELLIEAEKAYPLGYGTPLDVAGLVVYLLSDASRWMTGADLILDGGLTLT